MKQKILVEGNVGLLERNEILVTQDDGYTVLREKDINGNITTFIVVPLEEFESKNEPQVVKEPLPEVKSTKSE